MTLYDEYLKSSCCVGGVTYQNWLEIQLANIRMAVKITLDENRHLADGDVCTLKILKDVVNYE